MGRTLSITNCPIKALMATPIIVAIKPVMAAPIPAICPTGSMARERRFPKRKPTAKNCNAKKVSRIPNGGFPLVANKTI